MTCLVTPYVGQKRDIYFLLLALVSSHTSATYGCGRAVGADVGGDVDCLLFLDVAVIPPSSYHQSCPFRRSLHLLFAYTRSPR